MIEKLEWDSKFFKYPVGKLIVKHDINENKLFEILNKEAKNYNLVYIFLPEGRNISKSNCINHNIKLVDRKIVYQKKLSVRHRTVEKYFGEIESITGLKNYEKLPNLALLSGQYSRFNTDKNFIKGEFKRLYKKWLSNSINGSLADECFATKNEKSGYQGFVTCKIHESSICIGLIAVDPKESGQGIGTKLIKRVEQLADFESIKNILVTTQLENIKACRFYEKNGFVKKELMNVYHKWRVQ